jgi:hypothetical protein
MDLIDCCQSEAPEPDKNILRMSKLQRNAAPTVEKMLPPFPLPCLPVHFLRLPSLDFYHQTFSDHFKCHGYPAFIRYQFNT